MTAWQVCVALFGDMEEMSDRREAGNARLAHKRNVWRGNLSIADCGRKNSNEDENLQIKIEVGFEQLGGLGAGVVVRDKPYG